MWRAYVTNALPYVCIRSWLAAGFDKSQIRVLPQARLTLEPNPIRGAILTQIVVRLSQARLRNMTAPELLDGISEATGLHYNKEVLHDRNQVLLPLPTHCHRRSSRAFTPLLNPCQELVAHCEASDSAANRRYRPNEATAVRVNSHSGYDGHNAHARTRLDAEVWREFDRVANVHHAMFEELGLRTL